MGQREEGQGGAGARVGEVARHVTFPHPEPEPTTSVNKVLTHGAESKIGASHTVVSNALEHECMDHYWLKAIAYCKSGL